MIEQPKGIPTRKEIAKFFEGMNVSNLENSITERHNTALYTHAQIQEKQIKDLEIESDAFEKENERLIAKDANKIIKSQKKQIKEMKSLLNRYREMDKSQGQQIKALEEFKKSIEENYNGEYWIAAALKDLNEH